MPLRRERFTVHGNRVSIPLQRAALDTDEIFALVVFDDFPVMLASCTLFTGTGQAKFFSSSNLSSLDICLFV
jgi:hypothetical protein